MRHAVAMLFFILLDACQGDHAAVGLIGAVRSGDVGRIRTERRAALDAPSGGNGWTPLMHAIHKDQSGSVEALLVQGADPDRATPDGMTPLMMAAGYGYTDLVQSLLRHGAQPAVTNARGESALDWALSGTGDLDRFTLFQCQDETVRTLHAAAPQVRPTSSVRRLARFKRCASLTLVSSGS